MILQNDNEVCVIVLSLPLYLGVRSYIAIIKRKITDVSNYLKIPVFVKIGFML